jgi:hypothetical protein
VVVHLLQQVNSSCPSGVPLESLPGPRVAGVPLALLRKEAVYNAAALASTHTHTHTHTQTLSLSFSLSCILSLLLSTDI